MAKTQAAEPAEPVPTITLGGREWPLPTLAPRQNRIVVPALLELMPKILRARDEGGGDLAQLARFLDAQAYDRLSDIAFAALTRGCPDLVRTEFDELPIGTRELLLALVPVARAAGLFAAAKSVP